MEPFADADTRIAESDRSRTTARRLGPYSVSPQDPNGGMYMVASGGGTLFFQAMVGEPPEAS